MVIHLNEKLWFGKYKGKKLIEIIDENPSYIDKLLKENNSLSLNDDVIKYMMKNKKINSKYFTTPSYSVRYFDRTFDIN